MQPYPGLDTSSIELFCSVSASWVPRASRLRLGLLLVYTVFPPVLTGILSGFLFPSPFVLQEAKVHNSPKALCLLCGPDRIWTWLCLWQGITAVCLCLAVGQWHLCTCLTSSFFVTLVSHLGCNKHEEKGDLAMTGWRSKGHFSLSKRRRNLC